MKRESVEIRIAEDSRIFARYQGIYDRHISISTGALRAWHQPVIDAVFTHELGHHQLWHGELHLAMLSGLALICVEAMWSGYYINVLGAAAVHMLWRLLLEIWADRFSHRRGFDMLWAIDEHLALTKLSRFMRLQLKIRRLCLKAL